MNDDGNADVFVVCRKYSFSMLVPPTMMLLLLIKVSVVVTMMTTHGGVPLLR